MTTARGMLSAGLAAALAVAVAGCTTGGPGAPPISSAPRGVEGSWIDAQGTGISTFAGGRFQTAATDTGQNLADGSYTMTATATDASGQSTAISTQVQAQVSSVDLTQNPPLLSINGQNYTMTQLQKIIAPGL